MGNSVGIAENILLKRQVSLFYHYEPYDGTPADQDHPPPKFAPGGARFQKSMHQSTKKLRGTIAGTQTGKSRGGAVEAIATLTGELPYSMRYPDGADTGIKRALRSDHDELGRMNIRRWGRISLATGQVIDHNEDAAEDGTWDCGNIVGVGVFPAEKICHETGQQAWLYCYRDIRDNVWIPLMQELIPPSLLDTARGVDGFSTKLSIFYLRDKKRICLKTYEQGFQEAAEGKKVHLIVLDEEPLSRDHYVSCLGHKKYMSMFFTPRHGITWMYDQFYLPASEGRDPDMDLFHVTAYDCPFLLPAEIALLERTLKPYEQDAVLLGKFSRRDGRPYFDYDICKGYIDNFRSSHIGLSNIAPLGRCDTIRDAYGVSMRRTPADTPGSSETATWEIYEDVIAEAAYWMPVDCAKGADDPDEAQDRSAAYIFRLPLASRQETEPVHVATLHTTEPVENFGWLCVYAAVYYNRCLIVPESKGDHGSSFTTEIREYPHIFTMMVVNDKTRKPTEHLGFDTNARTRTAAINKLRKWVNAHPTDPGFKHFALLKEMMGMVWAKGRPDHTPTGTSDCVLAASIGLWVYEEDPGQIRNNRPRPEKKGESPWRLFDAMVGGQRNPKPVLGRRHRGRGAVR